MGEPDSRVPADVEDILVGQIRAAGELGGSSAPGGRRGGGTGGAWAAKRLRTRVEDRRCPVPAQRDVAMERVRSVFPRAAELATGDGLLRVVLPLGRTGLQQLVADIALGGMSQPAIRVYGKEGLLNRRPTARAADALVQGFGGTVG